MNQIFTEQVINLKLKDEKLCRNTQTNVRMIFLEPKISGKEFKEFLLKNKFAELYLPRLMALYGCPGQIIILSNYYDLSYIFAPNKKIKLLNSYRSRNSSERDTGIIYNMAPISFHYIEDMLGDKLLQTVHQDKLQQLRKQKYVYAVYAQTFSTQNNNNQQWIKSQFNKYMLFGMSMAMHIYVYKYNKNINYANMFLNEVLNKNSYEVAFRKYLEQAGRRKDIIYFEQTYLHTRLNSNPVPVPSIPAGVFVGDKYINALITAHLVCLKFQEEEQKEIFFVYGRVFEYENILLFEVIMLANYCKYNNLPFTITEQEKDELYQKVLDLKKQDYKQKMKLQPRFYIIFILMFQVENKRLIKTENKINDHDSNYLESQKIIYSDLKKKVYDIILGKNEGQNITCTQFDQAWKACERGYPITTLFNTLQLSN